MRFDAQCIECMIKRQYEQAKKLNNDESALAFMKDVLREILSAPEDAAAPYLSSRFGKAYTCYSGETDAYEKIKKDSNEYMLNWLPKMRRTVKESSDKLFSALKFAAVGNYIDFGALAGKVSFNELDQLLENAPEESLNIRVYKEFIEELSSAGKLVYILDNAGEIVADMLLIETLKEHFPKLDICAAVRGAPVQNDVTRSDAEVTGLSRLVRIMDNGTNISGTQLEFLSEEMSLEMKKADVILAKGQGNFETLYGCGLNVYYLFMCKCSRFTELFGVQHLSGVFVNERRLQIKENV